MIVTATGLVLRFAGGMTMSKYGRDVQPSELVNYRGSMFSDVPNFATTAGYTNASWTLKADLTADFIVRILRVMDRRGAAIVTPRLRDPNMPRKPLINLMSGYVNTRPTTAERSAAAVMASTRSST